VPEQDELTEEERKQAAGGVVVVVKNNHVKGCGDPPNLDSKDFAHLSVFQNCYGEQMLFVREKKGDGLGECYVQMGDAGWADKWPVKDGMVQGLIVNQPEATFILACWQAATKYDSLREADKAKKS
jgi:hypothetical protein